MRNGVIATVVGGVALAILGELWRPVKAIVIGVWEKVLAFVGLFGDSYSAPGPISAVQFCQIGSVLFKHGCVPNWVSRGR